MSVVDFVYGLNEENLCFRTDPDGTYLTVYVATFCHFHIFSLLYGLTYFYMSIFDLVKYVDRKHKRSLLTD